MRFLIGYISMVVGVFLSIFGIADRSVVLLVSGVSFVVIGHLATRHIFN